MEKGINEIRYGTIDSKSSGYRISYKTNIGDGQDRILLCLHGFGGDKNSSVISRLLDELSPLGIGVMAIDWPAHGMSDAKDDDLTVENCLDDIDLIMNRMKVEYPDRRIDCFATSFGGYLATLYRNCHDDAFDKMVLRSPALRMDKVFSSLIGEQMIKRMRQGERIEIGFERKMKLGISFFDDLVSNNAYDVIVKDPQNVLILQGDMDDVVPPEETRRYAERNSIPIEWFVGTDHRYKKTGEMEHIIQVTRDFWVKKC